MHLFVKLIPVDLLLRVLDINSLIVDVLQSIDLLDIVHRLEIWDLLSQHVLMDINELDNSIPRGLNVPLKDGNVWVDEQFDLLRGENTLKLLNSVSLLVFLVLLVLLIQLAKAELEVNVVRIYVSGFRVVSGIKLFAVELSAAAAASVDDFSGNLSPKFDKEVFEDKQQDNDAEKTNPDDHVLLTKSLWVKVESIVSNKVNRL